MIKEHTFLEEERGETQDHIDICTKHCPYPKKKCNGECDFYKAQAKLIRQTRPTRKNIVVY